MPSVAFYGPRRVNTEALPGVRKTAHETALSEGVGLDQARGQTAEALGRLGDEGVKVGEIIGRNAAEEKEQRALQAKRHEEVAAWESENKVDAWQTNRLYGTDGAMLVKGKAALEETDKVLADFDTFAGTVEAGLGTDAIKQNFRKRIGSRRGQLFRQLEIHGAEQNDAYEAEQLTALVANKQQLALQATVVQRGQPLDVIPIGVPLKEAVDAVTTASKRLGWSPEVLARKVGDIRTATHVGVVQKLLAQNLTDSAQAYYTANKQDIDDGPAKNRLEDALREGDELTQAQTAADVILREGGTLAEQRQKAAAFDGKKRRDVTALLEHEDQVKDAAQREDDKKFFDQVYTTVNQTHAMPTDAMTLSRLGTNLPALRSFVKSLVTKTPIETNLRRWYDLVEQARTDRGGFINHNLWEDVDQLSENDFQSIEHMRLQMAGQDAEARNRAQAIPDSIRSNELIVNDTLQQYGVDLKAAPGSDQHNAILALRRMLDRQVEQLQGVPDGSGKVKKLTNTEVQQQLDEILKVKAHVPGSWWNVWPMPGYFFDTDLKFQQIRLQDVPAADRQQIIDSYKRKGLEASDPQILDAYLQSLLIKRRPAVP